MSEMAPALTEAATQIRAKLPTVGHTTGLNGRVDCPSSSPTDPADPLSVSALPPPPPRSSSSPPAAPVALPPVAGSTHLLTLPKQHAENPTSSFNIGIRRVSLGGPTLVKTSLNSQGQPTPLGRATVTKLSNLALSVSSLSKPRLLANLQHKQQRIANSSSGGGVATNNTARTGELLLIQTIGRMNQQQKLAAIAHSQHTPSPAAGPGTTQTASGGGGKIMPHPAAAPNINTKTPGMGYTYKTTSTSQPQTPQVTPSGSSNSEGGGAPSAHPTTPTPPVAESDAGISLQAIDDIASITFMDFQSGSSTGMADVGLLNNVDRVAETAKRQKELERHADRLVRRIRRLQSRQTISHVQHQLSGFVDHQHKNLQTMAKAMKPQPTNSMDLKAELLQSEDVKSLSTAALVSLVRRLQTSQAMTLRQRLANSNQSGSDGTSVLRLDEDLCTEMNRVSSTLQKDLKHLESALDSDATESSSGGESCDEYDYDEEKVPKTCLRRRAEWKWATKRAAVAAKWTWLQAQVSDLEYRIRQQSDIYRQIRAAKGAVVLGDPVLPEDLLARFRGAATTTAGGRSGRRLSPLEEKIANLERKNEMSPCNLSTLLSNVDKQSIQLTKQLGNVLSPADSPLLPGHNGHKPLQCAPSTPPSSKSSGMPQNGFLVSSAAGGDTSDTKGGVGGSVADGALTLSFDPPSPAIDTSCQAARCRPVRSYGKRKLLTTSGLYQLSRKAARLSTVPCYCCLPTTPCAMCGGRYNNTQTVQPTVMPIGERVSLLDPAYHQVLSFPQDTPLPIHFESLLRCGEWQHKPLPTKPLRPLGTTKGKQKPVSERKYRKNAALLSSNKIRSKYELKSKLGCNHGNESVNNLSEVAAQSSTHSHTYESKLRKRKASLSAVLDGSRKRRNMSTSSVGPPAPSPTSASSRDTPSPLSHSCPSSTLRDMKDAQKRRRGESAFDINNIVIPYSMAASTRVEKLLYKEIITPKWRKIGAGKQLEDVPSISIPTLTPEQELASQPSTSDWDGTSHEPTPPPPTPITPGTTPQLTPIASTSTTTNQTMLHTPQTPITHHTPTTTPAHITSQCTSQSITQPTSQPLPITDSMTPQSLPDTPETPNSTPPTTAKANLQTETPHDSEKIDLDTETPNPLKSGPSFKVVDCVKPLSHPTPGGNGHKMDDEVDKDGVELEDLSEELIAARHMRCEIKEKKRFMSVIKKRSRSVRTDSIGAGDDALLPVADLPPTESSVPALVPTAMVLPPVVEPSTPPSTPAMAPPPQLTALLDEEMELAGERLRSGSCSSHEDLGGTGCGRRRSLSGRLRSRGLSASFTSTSLEDEDIYESGVDPWPLRTFPLLDADYESLFQDNTVTMATEVTMPTETPTVSTRPQRHASTTTKGGYTYNTATPENSNPTSPIPSSSNSSVMDDDPNDPEWTVVDGLEKPATPQPSGGIILKFSKR